MNGDRHSSRVRLVQCGWCPVIMADDMTVILLHFAEVHHVYGYSYSVRYIKGDDWDISEITGMEPGRR